MICKGRHSSAQWELAVQAVGWEAGLWQAPLQPPNPRVLQWPGQQPEEPLESCFEDTPLCRNLHWFLAQLEGALQIAFCGGISPKLL